MKLDGRLARRYVTSGLFRVLLLALVWLALMEGSLQGAWFGLIVVALAALLSLPLLPPSERAWRPRSLPGFALFFLRQSLLGGIDVARRALGPRPVVRPALFTLETALSQSDQLVLLANIASLMPGSVTVELEQGRLTVHVLDEALPVERTLRELERLLAEAA